MKNKPIGRGGPGRGQGRKPVADEKTQRCTVTLDPQTISDARDIGDGNLSEGIRRAVKVAKKEMKNGSDSAA